jgi:flagellar protein FlaJ
MKFKIPFASLGTEVLKKKSKSFAEKVKHKKDSKLGEYLKNSGTGITREEYIGIMKRCFTVNFINLAAVMTLLMFLIQVNYFYVFGPLIALIFSSFVLFSQSAYPRIFVARKQRDIEKNLLPALEDIMVQLNSGVPLFSVLVNISSAEYGELSNEFKKAVRRINAGIPEQQVLEELSRNNPSVFFKRTLWQISNGMKAGSDMTMVVKDSIKSLSEEQLIQIQTYGNKLNPLIVFYMLIAVIVPALSVTFLTIFSSMVNLPGKTVTMMFIGLGIMVIFMQIMFIGLIKSRRPTLL